MQQVLSSAFCSSCLLLSGCVRVAALLGMDAAEEWLGESAYVRRTRLPMGVTAAIELAAALLFLVHVVMLLPRLCRRDSGCCRGGPWFRTTSVGVALLIVETVSLSVQKCVLTF